MSFAGWRNLANTVCRRNCRQISSSVTLLRIYPLSNLTRQAIANDQKTIVCYHPPVAVPYENTKPLRRKKMWEKKYLTNEEVTLVRKLRKEDGFIWSVATLSRHFKVSPTIISRVAPASEERLKELENEREVIKKMRPHKRKLYQLQRQTTRQHKLKQLIAENNYTFPATTTEPSQ